MKTLRRHFTNGAHSLAHRPTWRLPVYGLLFVCVILFGVGCQDPNYAVDNALDRLEKAMTKLGKDMKTTGADLGEDMKTASVIQQEQAGKVLEHATTMAVNQLKEALADILEQQQLSTNQTIENLDETVGKRADKIMHDITVAVDKMLTAMDTAQKTRDETWGNTIQDIIETANTEFATNMNAIAKYVLTELDNRFKNQRMHDEFSQIDEQIKRLSQDVSTLMTRIIESEKSRDRDDRRSEFNVTTVLSLGALAIAFWAIIASRSKKEELVPTTRKR